MKSVIGWTMLGVPFFVILIFFMIATGWGSALVLVGGVSFLVVWVLAALALIGV